MSQTVISVFQMSCDASLGALIRFFSKYYVVIYYDGFLRQTVVITGANVIIKLVYHIKQ